jgi:hypothetical protein
MPKLPQPLKVPTLTASSSDWFGYVIGDLVIW